METVATAVTVSTAVCECFGCSFTNINVRRQFGYITSYKRNLDNLRTEIKNLTDEKSDMQRTTDAAENSGYDIAEAVRNWLAKAEKTIDEANQVINEDNAGHGEVRCLNRAFPNLWTRFKLCKKAEKMAEKILRIIDDRRSIQTVSFPPRPQMTASPFARGYEALESRKLKLNEIKKALKDPNIYKIGVHGMGGTGKTTLVKELVWEAEKERSFGKVVMATVTNDQDFKRIQEELADKLGINFEKKTKEGRAGELRGRLLKEESIAIILDDIWGELDLAELGVPFGDDRKGCKLVMTSRDLDVLKKKMGTQENIALNFLPEEESLDLFEKMAGDVVKRHDIKPIAREVVKCCAGLPLSIVIVAKSLKEEEDVRCWKDSLTRLSNETEVINRLRFSYDRLKTEELKSLFLLIGSVGQYGIGLHNNNDLFSMCWGLGIYKNLSTLAQARNRHSTLIKGLRASSLLLEDGTDEWLSMHDRVRDMARSVAFTEYPTFNL